MKSCILQVEFCLRAIWKGSSDRAMGGGQVTYTVGRRDYYAGTRLLRCTFSMGEFLGSRGPNNLKVIRIDVTIFSAVDIQPTASFSRFLTLYSLPICLLGPLKRDSFVDME